MNVLSVVQTSVKESIVTRKPGMGPRMSQANSAYATAHTETKPKSSSMSVCVRLPPKHKKKTFIVRVRSAHIMLRFP